MSCRISETVQHREQVHANIRGATWWGASNDSGWSEPSNRQYLRWLFLFESCVFFRPTPGGSLPGGLLSRHQMHNALSYNQEAGFIWPLLIRRIYWPRYTTFVCITGLGSRWSPVPLAFHGHYALSIKIYLFTDLRILTVLVDFMCCQFN